MGYFFPATGINNEIFQQIQKFQQMKKFFAIAILATIFIACNNSGKGKGNKDTTSIDTTIAPPVDTTTVKDTMPVVDSPAKM